jgi:hypothetical protein
MLEESPTWEFLMERAAQDENIELRVHLFWALKVAAQDESLADEYNILQVLYLPSSYLPL